MLRKLLNMINEPKYGIAKNLHNRCVKKGHKIKIGKETRIYGYNCSFRNIKFNDTKIQTRDLNLGIKRMMNNNYEIKNNEKDIDRSEYIVTFIMHSKVKVSGKNLDRVTIIELITKLKEKHIKNLNEFAYEILDNYLKTNNEGEK